FDNVDSYEDSLGVTDDNIYNDLPGTVTPLVNEAIKDKKDEQVRKLSIGFNLFGRYFERIIWQRTYHFLGDYQNQDMVSYMYDYVLRQDSGLPMLNDNEFVESRDNPVYFNKNEDNNKLHVQNDVMLTNYPNPFYTSTIIAIELPKTAQAKLTVFDLNGKIVYQKEQVFEQGKTEIEFLARNLDAGLYIYRLQTEDTVISKSMILIKE
ncbi:MAG: T9SS type A sorting domain-containing protein, partial [Bacteroidota bacterium]